MESEMHKKPWCRADRLGELVLDRRQRERVAAEGVVVLLFRDPEAVEIQGRMVDLSADGFRVVHRHRELRAGQEVTFHHSFGNGWARVVWNRVLGHHVESGLRILEIASG